MKKIKFKSLTMRIWATFTAIILIIICSISFLYLVAFRRINENAKINDLKVAHDMLLKNNNFDEPSRLDEFRNLKGSNYFTLKIDNNNNIQINDPRGKDKGSHLSLPQKDNRPLFEKYDFAIRMWMAGFIKTDNMYEKQFKESYKKMNFLFIISLIKQDKTGRSYLISYMPSREDNTILYMVIIIGAVFIAIGFITSKVTANYVSKPLKEFEDYTVKIAHKNWTKPIEVKSDDELGRLAGSMNSMQKELKHADEEEKLFLQSISHDLKTPVMVIISHAEAIIDGVYVDSVEKNAEIIKNEAVNLENKIKQILYLNTLDYVLLNNSEAVEISLHRMILNIINRFEVINSKIEWNLDIDEISIKANPDKIQVCIENVLDNSLRYAKEKIYIKLKEENGFAVLEIYNDGPNIDEKHLSHIFDNCYKDKTGNFGLGLAISKKIIDFYKGKIYAVNRDKGVSFIIKFFRDAHI